jgi:tRNA-dihydrouridine synthase
VACAFIREGYIDSTEEAAEFVLPTAYQRIDAARKQTMILHERDPRSVVRMRKHASWYIKGLPGASVARAELNACTSADDFLNVYQKLEQVVAEFEAINGPLEPVAPHAHIEG